MHALTVASGVEYVPRAAAGYGEAMSDKQADEVAFEEALSELESLVERLEEGELSLEESIKTYERGVALGRSALKALDAAEQRVQVLDQDGEEPRDFDPETA